MNWQKYFEMLEDWKKLPAYRAEPRVDSLIGFYLLELVSEFSKDKIVGIIPELPIRLATLNPDLENTIYADKSYKVDFYLQGDSGRNYFVEFKTDSGSRRDKQDKYLDDAENKGMTAIVGGITRIASASLYKKKYDHLIKKLGSLGLIDESRQTACRTDEIEIVYVQPRRKELDTKKVIDFKWIASWLLENYGQGEFENAFSKTLLQWAIND